MHKFCTSIVQYVYSACTETDGVYVRVACVCVCLYLPLQVDISPFSTSTDSILKPCALGILSLHSDRRNETDALEHVTLFGNLHNRLHNVPKGTGLNLKDGVFMPTYKKLLDRWYYVVFEHGFYMRRVVS